MPRKGTRYSPKAKPGPGGLGGRSGRGSRRKAQTRAAERAPLDVPKGTMKKRPEQIARAVKRAAAKTGRKQSPSPYRAAMTWLTNQAEAQSKTATPEQRTTFARAKDAMRSLFGRPQNRKGAGGPQGGAKQKRAKRDRRR